MLCFDIFIKLTYIEDNARDDVHITPPILAKFAMRNSVDFKFISPEVIKALRMRCFNYNVEENWEASYIFAVVLPTSTVVTRPPFLPCLGESNDILDNHFEKTRIKLNSIGN